MIWELTLLLSSGYEINRKHDLNICIAEFSVHGTVKVHINRHQRVRDLIK